MARETLLAIFSLLEENNSNKTSEILQHFYKVSIGEIPDNISEEIFPTVLYNPSSKDLFKSLEPDTLTFILSIPDKAGYIGISRDVFSREWSIELPSTLSWNDLLECAKQTPKSLISFK